MSAKPLLALIILLPVFSGCIAADETKPASTGPTHTIDPDSAFGLVTGSVYDEEAVAVPNVDVAIRESEFITKTDAEGMFQFYDVAPGIYILDAARLGFEPAVTQFEVMAGQEVKVELILTKLFATDESFFRLTHFTGYYDCALATLVWISSCSYPYTAAVLGLRDGTCIQEPACVPAVVNLTQYGVPEDIQRNQFRYNYTLEPGAQQVVAEMMWSSSSAATKTMYLDQDCGDYDPVWDDCINPDGRYNYADVEGTSPLRVVWDTDDIEPLKTGPIYVMSRGYLPFGDPQVALAQPFEMYNAAFYYGEAPDGFTSLPEVQ